MIKLITTDLDGTLLDDRKQVNPQFWEIEKKLNSKGILFAIASGRQYYNLIEHFSHIRDHAIFFAENGTYVKYKDKEIYVNPLDKPSATCLIDIGRKIEDAYVILCGKDSAYVEDTNEKFLTEAHTYYKKLEIVSDLTKVDDIILKVTLCDFKGAAKNSYMHYKPIEKEYKVAVSGEVWLDASHITANKGTAIEKVQKTMGILYDETMVFGDFLNDLEMMKVAKYSFAMKNAHPEVIAAAKFITEFDNNHNGVLETIKKYCLDEVPIPALIS
jgi:Cof subfamily protein (haloacid dehalogenase superfamily)